MNEHRRQITRQAPPASATLEARIAQLERGVVELRAEVEIARSEARSAQAALEGPPPSDLVLD